MVLSIDCGTQSLRLAIFSPRGELLCFEKIEYENSYFSPKPGFAEQEVQTYISALKKASENMKNRCPELWNKIEVIVPTVQRDTIVFLDKDFTPVRPAILWLDQRMASGKPKLLFIYNLAFRLVGMYKPAVISFKKGKMNWVKEYEPEIWEKTDKIGLLSAYINYVLTENFVDSIANQIGHIPFNYKKFKWSKSFLDYRKDIFPVDGRKLPSLVEPKTIIGKVTKKASELTRLPEGVKVLAGGSDKGCETIGTGCLDEKTASVSLGTTVTIQITTKKYIEPLKFMPPYPACLPKHYNPEVGIYKGFWMVKWFKEEFGEYEKQLAKEKNIPVEKVLDELLLETPAGSLGLILQPYWGAALKKPEARGAIIGFGDVHTKAHLYRAIIEGIAYGIREGIEKIQKVSGKRIEKVVVSGGGSNSDFVCQIISDVLNLPVYRGETYEASSLGASIIGYTALGVYPTFKDAVNNMVRYSKKFEPDYERHKIYDQLYTKIYKRLYSKLKNFYKDLQKITNYPEY